MPTYKCACGCGTKIKFGKTFAHGHNKARSNKPDNIKLKKNQKWCPSCKTAKLKTAFGPHKVNKDGLAGHCRSCKNEQQKKYQKNNKEKVNAKNRAWYHTDKKGINAGRRDRERDPERHRMYSRKRQGTLRAKQRGLFVETIDPLLVFKRDKGICGICFLPVELDEPWDIDHIVAFIWGGEHSYKNVQLSHTECNRRKKDLPVIVFPDGSWEFDLVALS